VVRERFGVHYTLAGLDLLLHRLGWSVQVPARPAVERHEEQITAGREQTSGLVQSHQTGALSCADAGVERLPSSGESGPSRRQINHQVALNWAGAEC
jgi:Winged helix-turn helix